MAKRIKAAKADCEAKNLPQTRKEVFFDVLKLHWKSFISYGALFLLFTVPFHALAIRDDLYQAAMMQNFATLAPEAQMEAILQVLSVKNASALLNVVSFLILSVFLSGMLRVIRLHAWEENVFFGYELWRGTKQNIKHILPLALAVGVLNALVVYAANLASVTENGTVSLILTIPVFAVSTVGIPTVAYALVSMSLYEHTFVGHIRLGAAVAAKSPLKTLAALACIFLPMALLLVPDMYCRILVRLFYSLFAPVILLGWYLFVLDRFDEAINKEKFPELVGKGTFKKNEND